MNFDVMHAGKKSKKGKIIAKLLKSPAIMASGITKTRCLSSELTESCERRSLLLQEKGAAKIFLQN